MTEIVLPQLSIPANECEWTLVDFSGVQQSPLSGAVQTISRGQRWQARLMWSSVADDERACLAALVARARGKANRIWTNDPAYKRRGNFPTSELLTNTAFNGTSGWTAYSSTVLKAGNRELQLQTNAATTQAVYQVLSLSGAIAYALRGCCIDGYGTAGDSFGVQWANAGGGTAFNSLSTSLRGLFTCAAVCDAFTNWNVFPMIMPGGGLLTSAQTGILQYASFARCALVVNPTAQSIANAVVIDALPPSTDGLLLAGDKVEINGEFKTVTADLHSYANGSGNLMFEPAMRVPVIPDNAPVIIHNPMMRGVLSADVAQPSRPGAPLLPFSDFDLTLIEA